MSECQTLVLSKTMEDAREVMKPYGLTAEVEVRGSTVDVLPGMEADNHRRYHVDIWYIPNGNYDKTKIIRSGASESFNEAGEVVVRKFEHWLIWRNK